MNKDIKRLLTWYDKKTGFLLLALTLAKEISALEKVPPSMVVGLAAFKKRNKNARLSLAKRVIDYNDDKFTQEFISSFRNLY